VCMVRVVVVVVVLVVVVVVVAVVVVVVVPTHLPNNAQHLLLIRFMSIAVATTAWHGWRRSHRGSSTSRGTTPLPSYLIAASQ